MRGQALVEFALCAPVLAALALGAVLVVRVADGRAGLDEATATAAAVAARAPDARSAETTARSSFSSIAAGYPLETPTVALDLQGFARGATVSATGTADVSLDLAPLPGLPRTVRLGSVARSRVQPWRTRP